jgi:spore maturation protein CgeB
MITSSLEHWDHRFKLHSRRMHAIFKHDVFVCMFVDYLPDYYENRWGFNLMAPEFSI